LCLDIHSPCLQMIEGVQDYLRPQQQAQAAVLPLHHPDNALRA